MRTCVALPGSASYGLGNRPCAPYMGDVTDGLILLVANFFDDVQIGVRQLLLLASTCSRTIRAAVRETSPSACQAQLDEVSDLL